MNSRRMAKAAEAVRETVSETILFKLRDPRVKGVTVLHAEIAPDFRTSKVYVTVLGDVKAQTLTMHGLDAAKGFIQSELAERLQTRFTPVLTFVLDPSVKKSIEVSRLLRAAQEEIVAADATTVEGDADEITLRADKEVDETPAEIGDAPGITGNDDGQ